MTKQSRLDMLNKEIMRCRKCPRLVAWREEVARVKRKAYQSHEYWGRPVPGFGDPQARVGVVGLAPGAHLVTLKDVADFCDVVGGNPRPYTVVPGKAVRVAIDVRGGEVEEPSVKDLSP